MTSEPTPFGPCHRCGEAVVERLADHEYRVRGKILMIFENVPVGVCEGCGERVLRAETAKRMEALAQRRVAPGKTKFVPVVSL